MGQSQGYEARQPHAHDQNYAWRGYCHSCSRAVSSGERGTGGGGSPARKPAHRATFGDFLTAESERLRGGESLSSEAMAVEDAGPAKAEEQDRLKALDASIANLERARGGKPDVAIDEVLRQKRLERQELKDQMQSRKSAKALLKAAIAAREKAVIKLEGLQKEEMDLTQLLLLKQQEISDAKSDAAEKAREVETLQARRLAEVDCEGSVSHVSLLLHLVLRRCHLSSGRLDSRRRFQRTCESSSRSGTAASRSRPRRQWIHIRRSPATLLPANPVSSTPVAATSTGGAAAGSRSVRDRRPAVAGCRRLSGSPSPGAARVTAGPAEQDFELCTMADFLRRVPLDELRGRGLMKGLQSEVLEQISSWPSAHAHGDGLCTQLIAYTDGSACMTRAWPRLAAEAGWGAVIFAVDASGVWKLAGGVWGPVETDPAAQLFFGASRLTSPVAEVTAIASVLRMLRAARVSIR